jgi:hypothetical protein
MPVFTFNPLEDSRWAEFVHRHPRASVFHTPNWLEALRRTHGYEPVVYTTCPPMASLTCGVVFCRVSSWLTGRRMVALPFTDHCEPLVEHREDWQEICGALQGLVETKAWKYVEIRPLSSDFVTGPGLEKSSSFCLHILDLRRPTEALFEGFHKASIQRKIRRAEREALGYEEGRSEGLLDKFYNLLLLTRRRHTLPPQPIGWFRNLTAALGDQLTIRVASKDGRPIASILTLSYRDILVYKYGCSDARSHNLGAMQSLLWKAIQDAKERGMRQFDLGRSDLDNTGLIAFKGRWGATPSMLTYARCSASGLACANEGYATQTASRVFARMPDWLLTAAGKLLYRHVG